MGEVCVKDGILIRDKTFLVLNETPEVFHILALYIKISNVFENLMAASTMISQKEGPIYI